MESTAYKNELKYYIFTEFGKSDTHPEKKNRISSSNSLKVLKCRIGLFAENIRI